MLKPDREEADLGGSREGESMAPNDGETMMDESWNGETAAF